MTTTETAAPQPQNELAWLEDPKVAAFVGPNTPHYKSAWRSMFAAADGNWKRAERRRTWSWVPFLLTVPWLLYRKAWAHAVGALALVLGMTWLMGERGSAIAQITLGLIGGMAAKSFMLQRTRRAVRQAEIGGYSEAELARRGGTSWAAVIIGLLLVVAASAAVQVSQKLARGEAPAWLPTALQGEDATSAEGANQQAAGEAVPAPAEEARVVSAEEIGYFKRMCATRGRWGEEMPGGVVTHAAQVEITGTLADIFDRAKTAGVAGQLDSSCAAEMERDLTELNGESAADQEPGPEKGVEPSPAEVGARTAADTLALVGEANGYDPEVIRRKARSTPAGREMASIFTEMEIASRREAARSPGSKAFDDFRYACNYRDFMLHSPKPAAERLGSVDGLLRSFDELSAAYPETVSGKDRECIQALRTARADISAEPR